MKIRVIAVSYINAAPLWWGMKGDPRVEVDFAVPSRIGESFASGKYDLAIVPTWEFIRGRLKASAGLGVLSHGDVRSVLLFHNGEPSGIKRVFLDPESRTSQAMTRYLFRDRGVDFIERSTSPEELEDGEAQLLIGDKALKLHSSPLPRIDLATMWKERTSLPALFALWARRDERPAFDDRELLSGALNRSMESLGDIVAWSRERTGLDGELLERYFTRSLFYEMGEDGRKALEFCERNLP